jgi:hypothetical protein
MAENISDKTSGQLRAMLDKNSGATASQVRAAIAELKKRGEETPPPSLVMGGRKMKKGGMPKKDKVPVITIGVGMAEFPKGKNKPHNYFAGGSVKMNPGLKALKKASPEAYNNIMKNK